MIITVTGQYRIIKPPVSGWKAESYKYLASQSSSTDFTSGIGFPAL